MHSKLRQQRTLIFLALCLSIAIISLAVILWPRQCGGLLNTDDELTFYFVTPVFSDDASLPDLIPEQWTLDPNSDKYKEIFSIMDEYLCHISLGSLSKNNHATWVTVYNSEGLPVFEYMGTNKVQILGTNYSIYGSENSGSNMINSIHSILSD